MQVYRALAELYGWTPDEIADLTPQQQAEFLGQGGDTMIFRTMDEFRRWTAKHARPGESHAE